jgi:hypothetical protein
MRERRFGDTLLVLRPLADPAPPAVRLRRALKTLLRAYGLRCTWLEGINVSEEKIVTPRELAESLVRREPTGSPPAAWSIQIVCAPDEPAELCHCVYEGYAKEQHAQAVRALESVIRQTLALAKQGRIAE